MTLFATASAAEVPAEQGGSFLAAGAVLPRPVAGEVVHSYALAAETGQTLLVTVEKHGVDLVAEVLGPDGERRRAVDPPSLSWGLVHLLLPADDTAATPEGPRTHRLVLRTKPGKPAPESASYQLTVEDVSSSEDAWRRALGAALTRVGEISFARDREKLPEALESIGEALALLSETDDTALKAHLLYQQANLLRDSGQLDASFAVYRQSLKHWRSLGNRPRQAMALGSYGIARLNMGALKAAERNFDEARKIWDSLDLPFEEAKAMVNQGWAAQSRGKLQIALGSYQEALPLFQEAGMQLFEAAALNNMGGVYERQGEPDLAFERYERALELRRSFDTARSAAQTLNNLAELYRQSGEPQAALDHYDEAEATLGAKGDPGLRATILSNRGFAYLDLGDLEQAQASIQESLDLWEEINHLGNLGVTLNLLGAVQREQRQKNAANQTHKRALSLARRGKNTLREAYSLHALGVTAHKLDEPEEARRYLLLARELLPELEDEPLEGRVLHALGAVQAAVGESREAQESLEEALAVRHGMRDGPGEAETLCELASVKRSLGKTASARKDLERALQLGEALRTDLASPRLRATFFSQQHRTHALYVDLLMTLHAERPRKGFDRAAAEAAERAHGRSLLDLLSAIPESARRAQPTEKLGERKTSLRRLNARSIELISLLEGRTTPATKKQVRILKRERLELLKAVEALEAELRRDPRSAGLLAPEPLALPEIQELLDPATVLLIYAPGVERTFLFEVSASGLRTHELAPWEELETIAGKAHEAVARWDPTAPKDRARVLEAAGQDLLGPLLGTLDTADRLAIVADGALASLPFAALRVPSRGTSWRPGADRAYLIERLSSVRLPSASALARQRALAESREPAPHTVLVIADAVYELLDPRFTEAGGETPGAAKLGTGTRGWPDETLVRLPGTRREAESIREQALAALPPGAPPSAVGLALDFAASRETLLSGRLRDYRVLHIATHGRYFENHPGLSGLALSRFDAAGRPLEHLLLLQDVSTLELRADLVVLSGCQTALGEEIRGEGLVGLGHGFMAAGSRRVLSSLWRIDDRATQRLMERFYRGLWKEGLPPAEALRQAQLELFQGRFQDPYFWAAFVLQGDW